jgi:transposase
MRPKNLGLSDEQVHHLEILASRPKTAQRSVYRAKIILSRLAGVGVRATAKAMNCKPATVRKWCRRVAAQGLDGLNDAQRAGINNLIKRIKRIGFGFRRFAHYRIRVLLYAGRPNWDLLATVTPR